MEVVLVPSSPSPKKSVFEEEFFTVVVLPAVPPPVRLSIRQFFEASLLERHSAFDSLVALELFTAALAVELLMVAVLEVEPLLLFVPVTVVRQAGTNELGIELLVLLPVVLELPSCNFFEALSVAEVAVLER